ncbi:MAG TPA: patatin-like phospholipase family protein [Flavisolibacter sp.]|nr:patatin-like phospholipase family protein [Flavisolibacter sp.]
MKKAVLFALGLAVLLLAQSQKANKRVLVVSGGGARGAWGAGFAKRLSDTFGVYNVAFGTSTGSLMGPLILLGEFGRLEQAYTTVTHQKIFDVNPFTETGDLRTYNSVLRVLAGKQTLGESNNLRKLIDAFLKDDDYLKIRQSKVLGVATVELATGESLIKFSTDIASASEMKDWIWASSNQPVLMSYYHGKKLPDKTGFFVDAGIQETVPVTEAIEYALHQNEIKDIDVIINRPKFPAFEKEQQPTTILKGMLRIMDIWRTKTEVVPYDVLLASQASAADCIKGDTIHINLHHFPSELFLENKHSLLFDPVKMTRLWEEGYKGRKDNMSMVNKPDEITISRSVAATYFSQLKANKQKLKLLVVDDAGRH